MSFGAIQFGGLASGLDTSAIINALLQLERRPIAVLEGRKTEEQGKLSLFGTLEGLVESLQKKAQDLFRSNGFFAYELAVGNEGVASFDLTDGAVAGSHDLVVTQLAQADRFTFDAVVDPDALGLGAGTITFDYYDPEAASGAGALRSYTVNVAAGADSLNGIASAINTDGDGAVTASVVNTGTEANPQYQLILTGDDTGADFAVQNLNVGIAGLTGQSALTTAQNAQVTIDGLAVERSSNVFSDVLAGVSFTVSSAATDGSVSTTFTIDPDPAGIKANVESFIEAYNEVIGFIEGQSSFSEEAGAGGDLFGDPALQTVRRSIHSALFDADVAVVSADLEGYSTLGLVGVKLNSDGTLRLDDVKFDEKLEGNLKRLGELFIDPTNGVLVALSDAIDGMVDSQVAVDPNNIDPVTGLPTPIINPATDREIVVPSLFDSRREAITDLIRDMDDQIERIQYRVEQVEISLVRRFANLESLIGGLNAQSAFLSSSFSAPR